MAERWRELVLHSVRTSCGRAMTTFVHSEIGRIPLFYVLETEICMLELYAPELLLDPIP